MNTSTIDSRIKEEDLKPLTPLDEVMADLRKTMQEYRTKTQPYFTALKQIQERAYNVVG